MTEARKRFTDLGRLRVFERADGRCHLCEQKIQPGQSWEIEHIMPLSMNGTNDDNNLAPAHVACHSGKSRRETTDRAKCDRVKAIHIGARKRGWPSKWKRKINGQTVLRETP